MAEASSIWRRRLPCRLASGLRMGGMARTGGRKRGAVAGEGGKAELFEIRSSKSEGRKKSEARNPKNVPSAVLFGFRLLSVFGFRSSDFLSHSDSVSLPNH